MTTALSLVNRVRRLLREEDVTSFVSTDLLSNTLLDLLNESKHDILETRIWDFDKRQDGELVTQAPLTGTDASFVNGSASYAFSTTAPTSVAGNWVAKLIATDDSSYGDTAFRVVSSGTSGGGCSGDLAVLFPGTSSLGAASFTVVFDEYLLPSTVRAVTSVRHQENDLRLIEVDKELGLDRVVQRPHEEQSTQPEFVYVGSTITTTYNSDSASEGSTGIGLRLHPTPSAALVLSYSYIYRHADMSSATDSLDNVDGSVEDLIVRLAYARAMKTGIGNEPQVGVLLEREVFARADALYAGHARDPMARTVIRPHFAGRIGAGFGKLPRNFGSL